jgi:hypothetical protein
MGLAPKWVSDMAASKLMDTSRRSAFAQGAARLDAIARPGGPSLPIPETAPGDRMAAISPDETWSRRFMSMGIGPDLARPIAPPMPQMEPVEETVLVAREQIAPERNLAQAFGKPGRAEPIGATIGKPVRRSLLGRLFRGG